MLKVWRRDRKGKKALVSWNGKETSSPFIHRIFIRPYVQTLDKNP